MRIIAIAIARNLYHNHGSAATDCICIVVCVYITCVSYLFWFRIRKSLRTHDSAAIYFVHTAYHFYFYHVCLLSIGSLKGIFASQELPVA